MGVAFLTIKKAAMRTDYACWFSCLQCPRCYGSITHEYETSMLGCSRCGQHYPVLNGIPQLVVDAEADTRLDEDGYDALMKVDEKARQAVFSMWTEIFRRQEIVPGDVLEIGCGSGLLTDVLLRMICRSVHASDISQAFLRKTSVLCQEAVLWRCDANQLPFADNSFDQIVGHSVLHHFLHYEAILARCFRILRPGGSMTVFEPVLQGKVLIALLANLIKQTDAKAVSSVLNDADRINLDKLIKQLSKHLSLKGDKEKLAEMEDKYIFDVNELQQQAKQAGFQLTSYRNNPMAGGNISIVRHMHQYGIAPEKSKQFDYLTVAVRDSLALLPENNFFTPMGFFTFTKTA